MKKFLSLVLALVMTMSLVTISAGAEFTDDTAVKYDEAVDVISALGIVGGYPDGSFKPQNTLTRGAAAKIICIINLGADVAAALPTNVASYTDVPAGSTYAGYIAYLKNAGVISGYADGSYKPGATLTGYAFLKMLLGALGYDQTIEGYVGENWQIAVAKRAKELKLFDDNKTFNGNLAATREEACLYALQALKSQPVKYEGGSQLTVNGISFVTGAELKKDGADPLYKKNFSKLTVDDEAIDAMGRPSTSYTYKSKDIGTYTESPKKIYTAEKVKEKTVYSDLGLTEKTTFKLFQDGAEADSDEYYVKHEVVKSSDDYIFPTYNVNGMVLEFYKDAKKVVALTPKVLEVTDVTEAEDDVDRYITLADGSTFTTEDFAEDDMVLCYTNGDEDSANGTKASDVKLAKKLTGKVTKVSGDAIWVDGTKYTKSATDWAGNNITNPAVKDEVEFYLDDAGYIVKLDTNVTNVSTSNVAFVEKSGQQTSGDYDGTVTYKATLRYADGTKAIVVLKSGDQVGAYDNKVVTYKTSSSKIVLANDSDKLYTYSGAVFTKGQPVISIGQGLALEKIPVTSSTKFVYVEAATTDDEAVATYTGYKNAPNFAAENTVGMVKDRDGNAVLVFVEADFVSSASETSSYIIYNDDLSIISDEDSDGYYEALMIDEKGEAKIVKIDDSVWNDDIKGSGSIAVALNNYTVDKDGFIDWVDVAEGDDYNVVTDYTTATYVKGDGIVTIGGDTFTYDEKTVVYRINDDKDTATVTTVEKVANNTNPAKNYDGIGVGVTEKNALKLAVVFLYEK